MVLGLSYQLMTTEPQKSSNSLSPANKLKVKIKVTLQLMVSKSWYQGPSEAHDQIFIIA
ncbi:hypothetical protein B7P43_G08267 [Cryptotermes secundus]|uniref:Uncharacterized protein n=1 Tax=Cryptotermes secundus TaxID=105785 RepID=A0A2J7RH62_9NEOP|nr:hypothetical protein B7P43_G08267 [Cryptotermes secundus]